MPPLTTELKAGLNAPICLTWELTYGCNLACTHCLSSSGRRDPRELSTAEARGVIDELAAMQVFYVNIGGGEPTIRSDFVDLVDYAVSRGVGVKFSTNGTTMTAERARRLAGDRLRRRADLPRRRGRRRPTTPSAAPAPTPPPCGPWIIWPRPGSGRSRSAWW